jgi:hypothetical protein
MRDRFRRHRSALEAGAALVLIGVLACSGRSGGDSPPAFPTVAGATPVVVPTFHCLGIYWKPEDGDAARSCAVRYRVAGSQQWRDALPLWFDPRNGEYRGSIVNLEPGTGYEIQLKTNSVTHTLQARTWSESFPVAKTIRLPARSQETLVVDQSGTPHGYVLYAAEEGSSAVIDVNGTHDQCVLIRASYVVLRGATLKGAAVNGITIEDGCHDLVIEGCDISGWGRVEADGWGHDFDAGVYGRGRGITRVIIQRDRLHHPRSNSNSWREWRDTGEGWHPRGPQGVTLASTGGHHVIRYNEVYSDEEHRFNDGMGEWENFSYAGFPNRDSDIYGNRVSECWDDGIEAEGANSNVRIWGNYITNTFVKIAIASTSVGPVYIWRNVAGTSRHSPFGTSDEDERGPFLKAGSTNDYNGGRIFVFHNTLLQPAPPPGQHKGLGCNVGLSSYGGEVLNMISRNNILQVASDSGSSIGNRTTSPTNDFDYDLYNGRIRAVGDKEAHGIKGTPTYDPADGPGQFRLAHGSQGYGAAVRLPNFNDGATGQAPDMGADEAGAPAMEFGVDAHLGR